MAIGGDDADTPFTDLRYMWYETVGVPRIYKSLWKSFSQRIKKRLPVHYPNCKVF